MLDDGGTHRSSRPQLCARIARATGPFLVVAACSHARPAPHRGFHLEMRAHKPGIERADDQKFDPLRLLRHCLSEGLDGFVFPLRC
jgi:hypothetical protein